MFSPGENAAFLLEAGQPVTVNGVEGRGVLSYQTEIVLDGETSWRGESLLVLTSLGGTANYGDLVVTTAGTYRVAQDPFYSADNVFCRLALSGPIAVEPQPVIILYLTTADGESLTTTEGVLLEAA
jgi:hypothetical protein